MCLLVLTLNFSIHYKCRFGESVYLSGSSLELGQWVIFKAIKLKWSPGDNWTVRLRVKQETRTNIFYKFFIAPTDMTFSTPLLWESGDDRVLDFKSITSIQHRIENVWNYQTLFFQLITEEKGQPQLVIIGDEKLYEMEPFQTVLEPERFSLLCGNISSLSTSSSLKDHKIWRSKVFIPLSKSILSYTYVIKDTVENHQIYKFNRNPPLKLNFYEIKMMTSSKQLDQLSKILALLRARKRTAPPTDFRRDLNVLLVSDTIKFNKQIDLLNVDRYFRVGNIPNSLEEAKCLKEEGVQQIVFIKEKNVYASNFADFSRMVEEVYGFKVIYFEVDPKSYTESFHIQLRLQQIQSEKNAFLLTWLFDPKEVLEYALNHLCFFRSFSRRAAEKFLHVDLYASKAEYRM